MLLLVSLLSPILGGILQHPTPVFFLIIASFILKAVAGGKRKAELTASEATQRADTNNWSAPCQRGWKRSRPRSSRISSSIRWPASTS
jgi:hypothetical protein